ncbi:MAG: thiol:disulfide interchange protein DsbA/DsbL [Gammaproteobacteria bacterium]|nr:thiol:disulfide interchange protein DsbA/DsbL [Gammaproteobacteria bacterium]
MARKHEESRRVRRLRVIIGGSIATVALIVVAVGLFFALRPVGEIAEGSHYERLEGADRSRSGPIRVVEYFSDGCIDCRNFDPQIESWQEDLPEGVEFERVPVAFSGALRNLAAAYYAAKELDILERVHPALFEAIHEAGLSLQTTEAIAAFVDGRGTDGETFRREMNSPAVRRAVAQAEERTRAAGIRAVPTLVVDDRYQISNTELSRQQILAVADELIAREQAERD